MSEPEVKIKEGARITVGDKRKGVGIKAEGKVERIDDSHEHMIYLHLDAGYYLEIPRGNRAEVER